MGLLITWYSHYYLDPSERQAVSTPTCWLHGGDARARAVGKPAHSLRVLGADEHQLIPADGFWQTRPESLYGARQALLVTVLGGLALLGGLIILYQVAGTLELPELIQALRGDS